MSRGPNQKSPSAGRGVLKSAGDRQASKPFRDTGKNASKKGSIYPRRETTCFYLKQLAYVLVQFKLVTRGHTCGYMHEGGH